MSGARRYGIRPQDGVTHIWHGGQAMGKTLNLCDCLLTMGREWHDLGRLTDAAGVLNRLAGFRNLPAQVAEETHARLATIYLRQNEYRKARRHLTSALIYRP